MPATPDPSVSAPPPEPVPPAIAATPHSAAGAAETPVVAPLAPPSTADSPEIPPSAVIDPTPERVYQAGTGPAGPEPGLMASFAAGFAQPTSRYDVLPTTPRRRITHDQIIELYNTHHDGLVRFAALVAPEDGMAEDLVQEAFVRLYKSWGRIRDPEKVPAYMRSTIANLARGRGRRMAVAVRNRPEPGPDAASAEEHAIRDENRDEVIGLLRTLPPRQRECLVLRYYQGLNESEIARTLKISVGSVRTHTSRGMAALQKRMLTPPADDAVGGAP